MSTFNAARFDFVTLRLFCAVAQSGSITLRAECIEEDRDAVLLRFEVADTGIGIAPDKLEHIFAGFSQAEQSTSRRYGGTGLGLAISRRLAELMGGRMWLDSEEGAGSTFTFTIPAVPAEPVAVTSHGYRAQLDGRHVLIIDDNRMNLNLFTHMLEMVDYAEPVAMADAILTYSQNFDTLPTSSTSVASTGAINLQAKGGKTSLQGQNLLAMWSGKTGKMLPGSPVVRIRTVEGDGHSSRLIASRCACFYTRETMHIKKTL